MRIKIIQGDEERRRGIHYELDLDSKPIGEGGMGVVYRGVRVDERNGLRTDVAIKVLHEDRPAEVYARAEREASIQIKHTNLVEMFGLIIEIEINRFGGKQARHYLISELLHGVDLSDLLNGKFDNSDGSENDFAKALYSRYIKNRKDASVEIIRNISSGVLALHDAGYIHRDIDPSNIMVTSDGCIKLIDFGIAKNINTLDTRDRLTTSAGKFIGKAEYASPELVLGDVRNQNFSTDIYALGILLFKLLTGKLPFSGTQYEVLQKQLKSKVPTRQVGDPGMAKVIRKATEKAQSARYASVAEFRVAVDTAARNEGIGIPRWIYGGIAAAAVIGGLVWGGMTWLGPSAIYEEEEVVAEAYPIRAQFDRALALLNSNDADSVRSGFEKMTVLAADYDSAKIELGLTYFPYLEGSSLEDTLSNPILRRRLYLNLKSKTDADSVIKYLKEPSNLPPEASYILGCTYYQKSEDEQQALTLFHQAKYSLERSVETGHGYDSETLKKILIDNISVLQGTK